MGNSCSSGQAHKDKDNVSQKSEESPSYHITKTAEVALNGNNDGHGGTRAEVILEPSSAGQGPITAPLLPQQSFTERKTGVSKILKGVASSSISDSMSLSSPIGLSSPRDFDSVPTESGGPQWVHSMSIALQKLLHGKSATPQSLKTRKIVIYVSAADSQDCCSEKGLLHTTVYPVLRAYCLARNFELHIVDLHWRSALEKQQDHEFPKLCLGELTRQSETAYIVPVLFLNSSLGTPLLPLTIESSDFEMALAQKSHDAVSKGLLSKWYQLDSRAEPPCYRLQPVGSHIPGFKESCPEEREKALIEWRDEIERTNVVLVDVFSTELKDTYLTTVVEQEVHNTIIMSQEMARRCVWINRALITPLINADYELQRRLTSLTKDLKSQLYEKHILRSAPRSSEPADKAPYLAMVTAHLQTYIAESINTIIHDHNCRAHVKPSQGIKERLFEELEQHNRFYEETAQNCVNKENILGKMKMYLFSDSNHPLILYGPPGSGKTTIMSRTAQCIQEWNPDANLVIRFAGLTSQSQYMTHLVGSITDQCNVLANGTETTSEHDIKTYSDILQTNLMNMQQSIIIIVDNIGELNSSDISWIPKTLPENVKLIITVTYDDKCTKNELIAQTNNSNNILLYNTLRDKFDDNSFMKLMELTSEESKHILLAGVGQYSHSVNPTVQDCVLKAIKNCTLPLYAKLLAWQTCLTPDNLTIDEIQPEIIQTYGKMGGPIVQQFISLLSETEACLGKEKVKLALSIMAASRCGILDSEMIDILASSEDFQSKDTYLSWAPATLFWSRLYALLAPFISYRQGCAIISNNILINIIRRRYQDIERNAHQILFDYFTGKSVAQDTEGREISQENKYNSNSYNKRKLIELPYQYLKLNNTEKFVNSEYIISDRWIFDKLCGTDCCELLNDILLIQKDETYKLPDHIIILLDFIHKNYSSLNYDSQQFYSLLKIYLDDKILSKNDNIIPNIQINSTILQNTNDNAQYELNNIKYTNNKNNTNMKVVTTNICSKEKNFNFLNNVIQKWYEIAQNPIVMSLIPLNVRNNKINNKSDDNPKIFDSVDRLATNGPFVTTLSTEREEICVWDVTRCCRVRTLTNITHPITLCSIDDAHCVVLCRRELQVFDLNLGKALVKLKGVMNQKMPYFGLHDRNHLVCLSRNRMYVNLMNLETGDCVTTFKAGEDRFLNSLLVSGDGRILVCGDETQKPFPLLVWHLTSRKLLYDLRIPHHDFVTSLAAITHEGSYVCVVCYEITEPSPNFIVVYDLQSGTLFKKWKPSCDTVSLEISSQDGCVLSGLKDARILVWDLVTGNCRFTLAGHTAPVTLLKLDPNGGVLLSADSECRDISVRLWDINKGQLIAVYTPPEKITACELISGGKYVMLALENHQDLLTLKLCGGKSIEYQAEENDDDNEDSEYYGIKENDGKTFNLKEDHL